MKNPTPARWAIGLLLVVALLAGCGSNATTMAITPGFVPAGFTHQYGPFAAHNASASAVMPENPNVPASVRSHLFIQGLPQGTQPRRAGGPPP